MLIFRSGPFLFSAMKGFVVPVCFSGPLLVDTCLLLVFLYYENVAILNIFFMSPDAGTRACWPGSRAPRLIPLTSLGFL